MKVFFPGLAMSLLILVGMACGGGDNPDDGSPSPGETVSSSVEALPSADQARTAQAEQARTPRPTPANNDLRRVSNALLGSGQEVSFWLRSISDTTACGAGCSTDAAARWTTLREICQRKAWGSIAADPGYQPAYHEALFNALNTACDEIVAAFDGDTPDDSEEWQIRALEFGFALDEEMRKLLEVGVREGFLN